MLEVTPGTEITIEANGKDEVEVVNALVDLVERRFGEECSMPGAPLNSLP